MALTLRLKKGVGMVDFVKRIRLVRAMAHPPKCTLKQHNCGHKREWLFEIGRYHENRIISFVYIYVIRI